MAAESAPPTSSPLTGTVLGRYVIERLLGTGGMGAVYSARHQDLGRTAALKILHERFDGSDSVRQRFLREGQAASRIRHPNIVDVYDVGTETGRAYLVMELLEGEDLRRFLTREGQLSAIRTADLLIPVIAALAAAHESGIIHRDLKPDNIFLASERSSITPKVLDFGISKIVEAEQLASLTGTGNLIGTPYYMSPEQAQTEKNIDASTDQYSLGVILYECVTGRRPIEESVLYRLIHRIVQGDFPTPRQLNPALPATFEALIVRAMKRNPSERFPTIRALGCALLPFASERVRANYAEELAKECTPPIAPRVDSQDRPIELATTLRESVHERTNPRTTEAARRLKWPSAIALSLGLGGALAWGVARFQAPREPEPRVPPVSSRTLDAPPSQAHPAARLHPAVSAVPALDPLASASSPPALPSNSASVPERAVSPPAVPKRNTAPSRPDLAPR